MLKLAMGSALLVTATQVVAVSLGATQGNVIIGRPLDLLVQTSITAAEAATGLCVDAEVLYGDIRVAPTAVSTAIQQIGADGSGFLRIQAREPVNEPIVTVVVRAGCTTSFRRSYTLLADVEPQAPAAAPAGSVRLAPAPTVRTAPVAPAAAAPAGPVSAGRVAAPPAQPAGAGEGLVKETPIRLSAPAPRPAAVTRMISKTRPLPTVAPGTESTAAGREAAGAVSPAPNDAPPGPRLQLEPVEMPSTSPGPAAPTEAGGPVTMGQAPDGSVVAEGAPAQAPVSAPPEALQQELEALRAEQERMRLALETMNAQLREAQATAQPSMLVYGLGGLSLLLLGGLWYALRSRRQAAESALDRNTVPWWESALPDTPSQTGSNGAATSGTPPVASGTAAAAAKASPTPAVATTAWSDDPVEGMEVAEGRESMFREVPVSPLDIERLQDVWQRVEFCESIGQHADGMEALRDFLTDAPRCSEGPYLQWLKLAHDVGTDADRLAAARFYETHFQRIAPGPAGFDAVLGVEDDAALVKALVRDWPEPAARVTLLAALSSQPGSAQTPLAVRSLRAFDDLVMLVGVLDHVEAMGDEGTSSVPVAGSTAVAAGMAGGTAVDDADEAFPAWQTAAEVTPTSPPMLDFELPTTFAPSPPAPATAEPSGPKPLDFDFGAFELEPREDKPKPPDDTPR